MKLTKKINLLHLGMEENLREYTPDNEFTRSVHKISMHTGLPATEYVAAMPDADVIAVSAIGDVTAELIDALPNLKLIHSNGVGFNCIDVEAAGKRGIPVCNCAGMNAEAAEAAVKMIEAESRSADLTERVQRFLSEKVPRSGDAEEGSE